MNESQIDGIVRHSRAIMIAGLAVFVLPLVLGFGFGILSGFMLFSLGVYCCFFWKWRSEPGVWMLALLLTVTLGPCWAYFEYLYWVAILAPPANLAVPAFGWNKIRMSLDASVSLFIFSKTIKLVLSVAIENWKRTQPAR